MYLKLSVAGHLTIFLTRTRGPFWSIKPARILWVAVLGTQTVATLIAVYGVFMTPLGWGWAAFVWGYALVWFLVNDRVKLLTYWVLDRAKVTVKPDSKTAPQPDAKVAEQSKAKVEPKPDAKAAPPSAAKVDAKPDMEAAPQSEAQPAPNSEGKGSPLPEAKAKADAKAVLQSNAKTGAKPAVKAVQPTEFRPASKSDDEAAAPSESKTEAKADVEPQSQATTARKFGPAAPPQAKVEPQSESKAEPSADSNAGVAKLVNTTLGDILLAGVLKDPQSAGRIIAEAISDAEAPTVPAKAPQAETDTGTKPTSEVEPNPEGRARTPPVSKPS